MNKLGNSQAERLENKIQWLLLLLNSESDSMANVVLARSESLYGIDCNRIFKDIASEWGRGGGKSNFVTGVIKKENVGEFISTVVRKIATK